ncbi:serine/threonine-protein kinase ULK3-like [Haliotis rubra]|uniref:serine/threonine-protein kinase ULK3-like n=1 Tax=Haliotis rubra TaxID=36100 RepID=UPI001EE5ABBF|nr:serine/threonine-protein kinase ULK3-like [Haliotis rubra]
MAKSSSASTAVPNLKDYVFTEKLGSGTYATVYKAYRKIGIREVVAIKCVLKSSLNKASTENLLTEIELLKKLKHPNIVELRDFQWDDSYIYLIMEHCSGGDFSHFIRKRRRLPEHLVKRFLQQLAGAMMYLWSKNVAHMDLKPQNILLTSVTHPTIKIADFGFAKHLFEGDALNVMRGSPLYMAPEIICKGEYDARVDLWSIGVILYECLFGRAPFASQSFKELGSKIWDAKPVELPYGVDITEEARDLLIQLLKRSPEERITFEKFFAHPFVDMTHMPSDDSMNQAIELVTQAVKKDNERNYKAAIRLYTEALDFFVAAVHYERNPNKKEVLRKKVKEYMDRAEVLKTLLKPQKPEDSLSRSLSLNEYEELHDLCVGKPELQAALRLIKAAESETDKEKFEQALHHYELALAPLVKFLPEEPKGRRKDLLKKELEKWMGKAEEIKSYLSVKSLSTEPVTKQDEEENDQYLASCCVQ